MPIPVLPHDVFSSSILPASEVLKQLGSSDKGLSRHEAQQRLEHGGLNALQQERVTWLYVLWRQLASPFVAILLFAATASFILGDAINGLMIVLFIAINTLLGFYQEYRSEQSLRLLRQYVTLQTTVRREGSNQSIDSQKLVRGDIVVLQAGDRVPADLRLLEVTALFVNESTLTGESAPVAKLHHKLTSSAITMFNARNVVFAGTTVVQGVARGVAVATGAAMTIASIAQLAAAIPRESEFHRNISVFSRFIIRLTVVTIALVFVANLALKGSRADTIELLVFSIALAVSVIPEALPLVTTFSLSRGALHLARRKVVVKRLSAIEDLGSIDVLCTDKTGTLTENNLIVAETYGSDARLLQYAAFSRLFLGERIHEQANAFDEAIWNRLVARDRSQLAHFRPVRRLPFDPDRRRDSFYVTDGTEHCLVVRGAWESIQSALLHLDDHERQRVELWMKAQGKHGRRVLTVAMKQFADGNASSLHDEESNLTLLGLISFIDPIKKTTKRAVQHAQRLGVMVKILTGDAPQVAGAVGHEIGLITHPSHVITGEHFNSLSTKEQHAAVHTYNVFARVSPQDKHNIVQLLQEQHRVGFLGEGINDAPALKTANVALVVQGAAAIAEEAADVVLLRKGLDVIVDGIAQGRMIFANTIKYIKATLASNFGNFYAVAVASLFIDFLPMLPVQILLLNLLSDFPMIAIATDTIDPVEARQPRTYNLREIAFFSTLLGIVSTFFDFMFFALFYRHGPAVLQTNWFIASILTELAFLFSVRSIQPIWRAKRPATTIILLSLIAAGTTFLLPLTRIGQTLFHFNQPTPGHVGLIVSLVVLYFAASESTKLIYYRLTQKTAHNAAPILPESLAT